MLFTSLKKDVQDIAPVRSTEIFGAAVHGTTVWRGRNESMANYATRCRKDLTDLKEVSDAHTVSADIPVALILLFSGIGMNEQAGVLAGKNHN